MSEKKKIVAILGMDQYNRRVWKDVRQMLGDAAELTEWSDLDLEQQNEELATALQSADCLFLTLIQFKPQADWLKECLEKSSVETIFAYESMPEVMAMTKVGDYNPAGDGSGMPDIVKKVAKMLVKGRDEDALYGYMKLLKIMRTMLPLIPNKAKDFKHWMQVYSYWLHPTGENLANMFRLILREYFGANLKVESVVEVPTMGFYHPEAPDYFKDASHYNKWQKKRSNDPKNSSRVGLLFFRKHLLQERAYIDAAILELEKAGLYVLPVFVMGVEGHVAVREWFPKENIDLLINMMGFGLIGGPAGSTTPGTSAEARDEIFSKIDVPYIVAQPLFIQDMDSWRLHGVTPLQSAMLYSMPEMDGAISPVVLGAGKDGRITPTKDRMQRLAQIAVRWTSLRKKPNSEKKLGFVVYDYPPGLGRKSSAALLDVPKSLLAMLHRLKSEGYHVGDIPETADELYNMLDKATDFQTQFNAPDAICVTHDEFRNMTTEGEREKINARWDSFPGDIAPAAEDKVYIGGLTFGNIYIGVQPRLGIQGDPMRLLFDKENTPHHQYISFYRWLSRKFMADGIIHVGMHGTAEWMPGLQLGLTQDCWPDALLGEVPQVYIYPVNNPSEANIAKRRGYATMISHAVPPLSRAGLYKELPALKDMIADYRERGLDKSDDAEIQEAVLEKVAQLNLSDDCPYKEGEPFQDYVSRLYVYLMDLENRLISSEMHVFGKSTPVEEQVTTITEMLKLRGENLSLPSIILSTYPEGKKYSGYAELASLARKGDKNAIALREKIDQACKEFVEQCIFANNDPRSVFGKLTSGASISEEMAKSLNEGLRAGRETVEGMKDNSGEMDALVRVLNGRYLPAGPGGDLIRDGANILPTGRNIHSIDPWRIPSEVANSRGAQIAESIIERHLAENDHEFPETVAQVLWGLDTIKTKGESIGIVIRLMGARPGYDAQGKISHYELIPLSELGRPRIDVLMQVSSIFRDNFGNLMNLLDRLVKDAAKADEPHDMNFIKKHVDEALAEGKSFESATSRIFTQAQGMYGSSIDEMVEDSAWESEEDLDSVFVRRTSYAYGGNRNGALETDVLKGLLGTVDRVVQQVDSAEFGVSDIDRYFSSSGSLQLSARLHNKKGKTVKLNYVESFTADVKVDDVEKTLRVEYRSKLLNPKWYENMLAQGHSGATEISNRFTYMLGWDAVSKSVDDWVYKEAAETYAFDPNIRERLAKANPEAMKNIVGRMLEASGRGMWQADQDTIDKLQEIYADLEDRLEGIEHAM
ncbi:magnesium chelatase, H subunit [Chloroherpeton thalassium ATCC 35110]|uniref:magnesium chelatase n=1 Tax=Chloroherpeton thalassium (strain ATCC 35110 / GB-78) TaxID=517418 RepID=B3QZ57_CHLT3|nr:magnesium chelatase subunit H [Chloroherpeton thalassium]ACF13750.1 magnesium chelatase, H subunit [Chloroherpeton thalassium ATCC 35110]